MLELVHSKDLIKECSHIFGKEDRNFGYNLGSAITDYGWGWVGERVSCLLLRWRSSWSSTSPVTRPPDLLRDLPVKNDMVSVHMQQLVTSRSVPV